jgi:hypothetical protein
VQNNSSGFGTDGVNMDGDQEQNKVWKTLFKEISFVKLCRKIRTNEPINDHRKPKPKGLQKQQRNQTKPPFSLSRMFWYCPKIVLAIVALGVFTFWEMNQRQKSVQEIHKPDTSSRGSDGGENSRERHGSRRRFTYLTNTMSSPRTRCFCHRLMLAILPNLKCRMNTKHKYHANLLMTKLGYAMLP